jgi:hypothetical protein
MFSESTWSGVSKISYGFFPALSGFQVPQHDVMLEYFLVLFSNKQTNVEQKSQKQKDFACQKII